MTISYIFGKPHARGRRDKMVLSEVVIVQVGSRQSPTTWLCTYFSDAMNSCDQLSQFYRPSVEILCQVKAMVQEDFLIIGIRIL